MKRKNMIICLLSAAVLFSACGAAQETPQVQQPEETAQEAPGRQEAAETTAEQDNAAQPVELTILAAASLTDVCGELETMYESAHPEVSLIFSYAGSGALQTQIEEGAPADLFFSASTKQMNALKDEGLMDNDSITELLENKIVLIVPKGSDKGIASFEDVATDKVGMIGLGDPESVPAGQYAQESFTTLGIWDAVQAKANYGSDVRTVLAWVSSAEVDCGVVYQTDAFTTDEVEIVATAPEGSCKAVIYPVGIVASTEHPAEAAALLEFFKSNEVKQVFERYGF